MAIFLVKCLIIASTVLFFIQTSCGTVPKSCHKSGSSAYCYPHIPSFLNIYGWDLSGITTFRLYSSGYIVWTLQSLPGDIFKLASDINNLYLNNAGLEKLPCEVFQPFKKSLRKIYLQDNLFKQFPICALQNFKALQVVQLENQILKSFQADTINWTSIRTIYLRNNELSIMNISQLGNQNEVNIYLDDNQLSTLQMFDINHIRYLSAKNNLIRHVNVNIFQNSKTTLTFLDLSWNMLHNSIWYTLADVSSLQTLKLNNNQVSVVSSYILNFASNLEYLDLSSNQLTSLEGVTLRSGKLAFLLLGSNNLTEVPPFLTSNTETFDSNPQLYDLSNNSIRKIYISIPSPSSSLTVRLDRNKLKEVTFDSNKIEIRTLNISHNEISLLPNLPKAKTYVMSYNPLNTTDVIRKLTNEMLGASVIELENVGLFCEGNVQVLPTINGSGFSSLNLRHNCIPLDIICHINTPCTNYMSLYLDNNTATPLSCSLRGKCFNVLSVNECDLNDTFSEYVFGESRPKHLRKLFARHNDFTVTQLIHNSSVKDIDISYDLSGNQITTFEGFNTSADMVNLNFKNNKISSIKHGIIRSIDRYSFVDYRLSFANNSLVNIIDSLMSIYFQRSLIFRVLISIDMCYNFIEEIKFKDLIQFELNPRSRIYDAIQLTINVSHNSIQALEDCLEFDSKMDLHITLDLSFNKITALPNTSCGMSYKMHLGYNSIQEIKKPIPSARTQLLDLQWNNITEIHLNAFDNLTGLTQLNLRGNRINIFPSSIKTVVSLNILDISFNKIRHISQKDFSNLNHLQKLTVRDNDFFIPANDLQLSKFYHLEANEIRCDCDMLFLRNHSFSPQFKLTGRCTSPPEYEGYHVSCFPVKQCIGIVPLYITKTIVETCNNDQFSDIAMDTQELENTLIIHIKITGQRKPRSMCMKAYKNEELVKLHQLNITDRSNSFWLDRNLGSNRMCFLSVFYDNDTTLRCFEIQIQSLYKNNEITKKTETLYGISSLLAISLFVNVLVGIFSVITYRNKHKKADNHHSKKENNIEIYEITSATNINGDSSSQPVYEDISKSEGNYEHSYGNLALDI